MFGLSRSLCRASSSHWLHVVLQTAPIIAFSFGLVACKNENTAADYSNPALEDYLRSSASLTPVPDIYSVDANAEQSDRFSQTNVQELGVDEADLVKFDGRYLYVVQQPTIDYFTKPPRLPELIDQPLSETLAFDNPLLFDSRAASLAPRKGAIRVMAPNDTPAAPEVTQIPIDENTQRVQGLYSYSLSDQEHGLALISEQRESSGIRGVSSTHIELIDVEAPSQAETLWKMGFEGSLISSRRIGNKLYLVTQFLPDISNMQPATDENMHVENYLPHLLGESKGQLLFMPSDCVIPSGIGAEYRPTLMSIVTVDLDQPKNWQAVCMAGSVSGLYSSSTATYLLSDANYFDAIGVQPAVSALRQAAPQQQTHIHKFSLTASKPEYRGTGSVPGLLHHPISFSLGEHDDVLQVISTENDWQAPTDERFTHFATSLAEAGDGSLSLEVIGQIPNDQDAREIGKPGERVYSTRFFNDRAYVVTYQNIDPLYVINFTDPANPFIEGEVELPGFSEYLHPLGENTVLGIGKDTRETDLGRVTTQGLKLALFNVSNPAKPTVEQEFVIGAPGTSSSALYDHHAISFLNDGDGDYRFTLPVSLYEKGDVYPIFAHRGLYLFELSLNSDTPIVLSGVLINRESRDTLVFEEALNNVQRSLIVAEYAHFIDNGRVWSALWGNPKEVLGPQ